MRPGALARGGPGGRLTLRVLSADPAVTPPPPPWRPAWAPPCPPIGFRGTAGARSPRCGCPGAATPATPGSAARGGPCSLSWVRARGPGGMGPWRASPLPGAASWTAWRPRRASCPRMKPWTPSWRRVPRLGRSATTMACPARPPIAGGPAVGGPGAGPGRCRPLTRAWAVRAGSQDAAAARDDAEIPCCASRGSPRPTPRRPRPLRRPRAHGAGPRPGPAGGPGAAEAALWPTCRRWCACGRRSPGRPHPGEAAAPRRSPPRLARRRCVARCLPAVEGRQRLRPPGRDPSAICCPCCKTRTSTCAARPPGPWAASRTPRPSPAWSAPCSTRIPLCASGRPGAWASFGTPTPCPLCAAPPRTPPPWWPRWRWRASLHWVRRPNSSPTSPPVPAIRRPRWPWRPGPDGTARKDALKLLAGSAEGTRAAIAALSDSDSEVRKQAVESLGWAAQAHAEVLHALPDPDPDVRVTALIALRRRPLPGSAAQVTPLLADADPEVRLRAAQASPPGPPEAPAAWRRRPCVR